MCGMPVWGLGEDVSALYVGHLQVEIQLTDQLYKMCGVLVWGLGEDVSALYMGHLQVVI